MIRHLFAALIAAFALNAFAAVEANQASRADLETVKGIGPGLSGKIVEARKAGAFKNWGDLVERIGGVGPGSAARLSQAGLTVAGAPFDPSTLPAAPVKGGGGTKSGKTDKAAKADAGAKAKPPAKTGG
jgi:competence protein ComEA